MLKALKRLLTPKKFIIYVDIDTDDDALVEFEGKRYCFYGDNLKVSRRFRTVDECYDFLRNAIVIPSGYKCSGYIRELLDEFIETHKRGEHWMGYRGNQTIEIDIYETPSKST